MRTPNSGNTRPVPTGNKQSLAPSAPPKKALEVSYKDMQGNPVDLTLAILNNYLSVDGSKFTEAEAWGYLMLCKARKLNPIEKDCFLVKYGGKPTVVVTRDCYNKRANANPDYQGKESGIVVLNMDHKIELREGTILLDEEELLGGWCKVWMGNRTHPELVTVNFKEAARYKSDGTLQASWATQPAWMITKVAEARALKAAIPEQFSGTYIPEDLGVETVVERATTNQTPFPEGAIDTPYYPVSDDDEKPDVDASTGEVMEDDGQGNIFEEA